MHSVSLKIDLVCFRFQPEVLKDRHGHDNNPYSFLTTNMWMQFMTSAYLSQDMNSEPRVCVL